jgi:hypothetical protein
MTEVRNARTVTDADLDALLLRRPKVTDPRDDLPSEPSIKPLSHWRSVGDVAQAVVSELPPVTGGGATQWVKFTHRGVTKIEGMYGSVWEAPEGTKIAAMQFATDGMLCVALEDDPARAPFPAKALRDRPWDISALVE